MPSFRQYLGDGLYADFDGTQIVLTAEDGIRAANTVYLEPSVYEALKRWHASKIAPLFQQVEG
jgi:hypothetical protein